MKPTQKMEISNSTRLSSVLTRAIKVFSPKIVIETGTYLGTGSTRTILEAFGHRRPQAFYTIEVSKQFHEVARRNLSNWPFVHCLWGLSVDKQQALDFVANDPFLKELDPKLDIYVDFLPDPAAGYMNEIHGGLGDSMDMEAPQGLLGSLIEQHKQDRPMICLDSAGGLGWMEFQEVLRLQEGNPFLLFLDDINHVKHYRSKITVEHMPEFSVIDCDWEDGWMIATYNKQ